jgi:hypothetical protein
MSQDSNSEELVTQIYKGRERRMYPEVAEYLRTFRQVDRDYEDAISAADYARRLAERNAIRVAEDEGRSWDYYGNDTDRRAHRDYRRVQQAAYDAATRAKREARRTVLDGLLNSSHREVQWIAQTILRDHADNSEQTNYARDILAILPATTEQIWAEAKDNRGMCDVFDRYYDQAEAAGVFSLDGKAVVAAREISALRNYIRRNYGQSYVGAFMEKLSPILKAYQEDYDAKLVAAKAEWQGLDEAWRSERSRRAAATRAANRQITDAEAREREEAEGAQVRSVITTQSAMTGETIRAEYDESGPVNKEAAPALRIVANPA